MIYRIMLPLDFIFDCNEHAHTVPGISQTAPDQALSVRELYSRYTIERPMPVIGQPFYNGDDENSFIELESLTIQEKLDMKRDVDQFVTETTTTLQRAKDARALADKQAKDAELQALRDFKKSATAPNSGG